MRIEIKEEVARSLLNLKGPLTLLKPNLTEFSYEFEKWLDEMDINPDAVKISCERMYCSTPETRFVPIDQFQSNSVIPTRDVKTGVMHYVWAEDKWKIEMPIDVEELVVFVLRWT